MKGLGDRLKKARIKKGLTQIQVGEAIGISYGTLSGYERDYRNPDNQTLIKLANLYHVEVSWLLGIDSDKEKSHPATDGNKVYVFDENDEKIKDLLPKLSTKDKEWLIDTILRIKRD